MTGGKKTGLASLYVESGMILKFELESQLTVLEPKVRRWLGVICKLCRNCEATAALKGKGGRLQGKGQKVLERGSRRRIDSLIRAKLTIQFAIDWTCCFKRRPVPHQSEMANDLVD